jgi:hypothetical protein
VVAPRQTTPLTHARLLAVLSYDPITGFFHWRQMLSPRGVIGSRAGSVHPNGYRLLTIDGVGYLAHRVAWFYVHGVWPSNYVDHKNHKRDDNWIDNLRDTSQLFNRHNSVQAGRNNQSGFLGVVKTKRGRFMSRITYPDKKNHYLGTYDTPEEAHAVFMAAKQAYQAGALL